MITLLNNVTVQVEFVDDKTFSGFVNQHHWKRSKELQEEFNEEIYVSEGTSLLKV